MADKNVGPRRSIGIVLSHYPEKLTKVANCFVKRAGYQLQSRAKDHLFESQLIIALGICQSLRSLFAGSRHDEC